MNTTGVIFNKNKSFVMQNRSIDGAAYCRQATDGATSIKIGISFTNNNKQIISTYKKNILKVRNT